MAFSRKSHSKIRIEKVKEILDKTVTSRIIEAKFLFALEINSGCWKFRYNMDGTGSTSHTRDDEYYDVEANRSRIAIAMCTLMGEDDCGGVFQRDDRYFDFRHEVSSLHSLPDEVDERAEYANGMDGIGERKIGGIWVRKPYIPVQRNDHCEPDIMPTNTYFTNNMNEEWQAANPVQ